MMEGSGAGSESVLVTYGYADPGGPKLTYKDPTDPDPELVKFLDNCAASKFLHFWRRMTV
jgi:hypothetical protein